jgi:hypothetical protein
MTQALIHADSGSENEGDGEGRHVEGELVQWVVADLKDDAELSSFGFKEVSGSQRGRLIIRDNQLRWGCLIITRRLLLKHIGHWKRRPASFGPFKEAYLRSGL